MKNFFSLIALVLLLGACKSQKTVSELSASDTKSVLNIVNGHYKNMPSFETATIRSSVRYADDNQKYNATADIRIQKDEKIFVNVKFLGISVAKALITPDQVSYYVTLNRSYFEGDFSSLSQWIGTDLNFQKVQNLLLGNAFNDLTKEKMISSLEDGLHKLEASSPQGLESSYYFEDQDLLLKKESLVQSKKNRSVTITYPSYQQVKSNSLPTEIIIEAEQEKSINLNIVYKQISLNDKLDFDYNVPSNYKRININ